MPSAKSGEILIDGEAIVEVLAQVHAAILVREAETPLSVVRPGDASDDPSDKHRIDRVRHQAQADRMGYFVPRTASLRYNLPKPKTDARALFEREHR